MGMGCLCICVDPTSSLEKYVRMLGFQCTTVNQVSTQVIIYYDILNTRCSASIQDWRSSVAPKVFDSGAKGPRFNHR